MLLGCSHNYPAPVFDLSGNISKKQSHSQVEPIASTYVVMPGDTLFSIAWYHSVDYRDLAHINGLTNNLIYPGQKLLLANAQQYKYFDPKSLLMAINLEVLNKPKVENNNKSKPINTNHLKNIRSKKSFSNKNNIKTAKVLYSSLTNKTGSMSRIKPIKRLITSDTSLKWIWPADGKILTRFSTKSNASRGLDIDATRGQPVRASAPGRVVYEGNGLRGYGNLVIIKHNNNYLSAYAHNDKIHVSENEIVKSGQRIADVGSSGAQRDKLHFEIRYKGKPVDPLNYLPEKKF